jgi:quercetin dioxygenase-like cupin family protein
MELKQIRAVPFTDVEMEGVKGARLQTLIGAADGAPAFTLRLFYLEAGGHSPRHSHPYEHEVIVHEGSGTLWSQEEEYPLDVGTVALVMPGEEHQFTAGPKGMTFFCLVPHVGHKV